ncbi:DUF443 family protein, partial [Staphylococcus aureus]|uniref:DUF443 family protein n=2 Tax=Staphylococcus aureus TaxID=1280 RepID=UPI001BBDE162
SSLQSFHFFNVYFEGSISKHFFFIIFAYLYFGGFSFFTLYALITIDVQNIIIFICWGAVTMFFFFINIVPIGIKKAHVILLKKAE